MLLKNITTLQHKSLKEEIFGVLHDQIITGRYFPGDWLRQDEIAEQIGVSMTPVREALDLLVAAGLAERVPYRGVRIQQLSTQEILEAYELRLLLEPEAARQAAQNMADDQIVELKDLLNQMQAHQSLNDMSLARQLSRKFHKLIVDSSGNALLIKVWSIVSNRFPDWMLYEAMHRHPDLLDMSMARESADHAAIVDALASRDPQLAGRRSEEHIFHLGRDLEELLDIPARKRESNRDPSD